MNLKYIGEAVALLGIAYSIIRWIARNVDESDARPRVLLDLGLTRAGVSGALSHGATHAGGGSTPGDTGEMLDAPAALPHDPGMLDGAAAMFGLTREELVQMEPRKRALLLSGYRAAREASHRALPGNDQPA